MNINTLKYELIEWLTRTNDSSLLNALKSIKDSDTANKTWLENLTKAEQESLSRGIADHEKDNTLTGKEFWSGYEDKI